MQPTFLYYLPFGAVFLEDAFGWGTPFCHELQDQYSRASLQLPRSSGSMVVWPACSPGSNTVPIFKRVIRIQIPSVVGDPVSSQQQVRVNRTPSSLEVMWEEFEYFALSGT